LNLFAFFHFFYNNSLILKNKVVETNPD